LNYQLNSIQEEILVGILLGDASLERGKSTYNTRLRIEQSLESHKAYLYFLYSFFIDMTKTPPASPSRNPDKRTGKVYNSIKFQTLSFPCLNKFYELFYNNNIKIVPVNIAELLTARSLAFWIADDGGKSFYGQTILHTNSFTFAEIELLQAALLTNFNLRTRVEEKRPGQWIIIIPVKQETSLADIVKPFMPESMMYKLHLPKEENTSDSE